MKTQLSLFSFLFCFQIYSNCPKGFIEIPANKDLNVFKPFCVMKYSAKKKFDHAVSVIEGTSWISVTFDKALKACQKLGKGFGLINNEEWMTIANNIENVASNWSGNSVGVGFLNRGHSDNNPGYACDHHLDNVQGDCLTKGKSFHQKRTHSLSNGEIIWDIAGNLWEWIDWQVPFLDKAVQIDNWVDLNKLRPEIETGKKMDMKFLRSLTHPEFDEHKFIGKYWSGKPSGKKTSALRGGRWNNGVNAGIYTLDLSSKTSTSVENVTFRCVKR